MSEEYFQEAGSHLALVLFVSVKTRTTFMEVNKKDEQVGIDWTATYECYHPLITKNFKIAREFKYNDSSKGNT